MLEDDLEKKFFLIACENDALADSLVQKIQSHFGAHMNFFRSRDGSDAMAKIRNAPPHVLIIDQHLPKVSAEKLTEWVLQNPKLKRVGLVLISMIPENEHLIDEVAVGRVQFLELPDDDTHISRAVTRALNYAETGEDRQFHVRYFDAGDTLIREGEPGLCVYILKLGQLKAVTRKSGQEVFLGNIDVGEFVGEMAYINGEPRSADVVALATSELIEIPVDALDLVLFQKPAWAKALMRTLSKRLKIGNEKRSS